MLKHPGVSHRQEKKEDKRGSNNQETRGVFCHVISHRDEKGFLPSDPSPRRTRGFCHQIPHYGQYADGLPWACYPGPAASSRAYSAASSWTHPVPAPSRCPRPASLLLPFSLGPLEHCATGLLPDPGGDYPRFMQFLPLSIFSIARLPFPITPILNSVRPPLSSSPLLTFVINWSDQHLNRCFLISCRAYIFQRTSSPSYKMERDKESLTFCTSSASNTARSDSSLYYSMFKCSTLSQ